MLPVTTETITETLRAIKLPGGKNIVELNMVSGLVVKDGNVSFTFEVPARNATVLEPFRAAAEKAVLQIPGVNSASVVMTAHRAAPQMGASREKISLPSVKHIVAVASGKGGVGKSTTAANLAIAAVQEGLKIGLLDADIYGPSMTRMFNAKDKPETGADKKMIPANRYGLSVMSMGMMVPEETPMVWRGPMVHGAITQLFRDVAWGELDILFVDMPPGTGDAQLTMAQFVPLSGAVIVSTPQDIALIDARKGLAMFQKTNVPVLGIIENMSFFVCPHCGERSDIFSHGGAHHEADKLGVPFLGEIPLNIDIRMTSDEGAPITQVQSDGAIAKIYRDIVCKLKSALDLGG